ncbi:3-oxoacyl-[acyl-carrier-protein] synthase, mitochondrial [Nilaparvata lugens]|uniref:3-oxoacyl-[acyl-carrier-protein] synthase, mitochondrial n=1 Tax=Nilaparvata lugens TaxID=108931 RepID=UPI00193E1BB9|nr:3-oxoacyl-[acyl-carrier-protein] synthase, mitochondrial [Nilaparvata lugens]
MRKRVVITGLGLVSPVGCTVRTAWNTIITGGNGISRLTGDEYSNLPCQVAATIPKGTEDGCLNILEHFKESELRNIAPASVYSLIAAKQALEDSKWLPEGETDKDDTGVCVGMGMVDLVNICESNDALKRGYNRVSPYFVPRILPNMAAGLISIKYGLRGPNHAVSTACATGAHAIGDAFKFIQNDYAKVMVCGGTDACINPLSIAGFSRCRALSTGFNETPKKSSRPFDKQRDGFVMGEGSAVLILEELEHALEREARIYGEVLGYGLSGDGSHMTSPSKDGRGAILAMKRALKDADLQPSDITYVNAHATSTPLGDAIELKAIKTVMGDHVKNVAVSSTKGAHGHLLGAAGNVEAIFTVKACETGEIPPTINLENVCDEGRDLNCVANEKQDWNWERRIALKNSFGFGGTNACLCLSNFVR